MRAVSALKIACVPFRQRVECVRADTTAIAALSRTRAVSGIHAVSGTNAVSGVSALAEPPASFDCVLLDPPCSALGLRPRIVQTACAMEMGWAVQYQRAFLWSAVRMLRAGGVLVYSTCTITPAENEGQVSASDGLRSDCACWLAQVAASATDCLPHCMQVAWALAQFPALRLVPAEPRLGACGRLGCGLTAEQVRFT